MRLLPSLILLAAVGCQHDKNSPPLRSADYSVTPQGHTRTGGTSIKLDEAVDSGFSKFKDSFPELSPSVNTVVIDQSILFIDGVFYEGYYSFGDAYVTVSLAGGINHLSNSVLPHELLHTVIQDPQHTQRIYWDRLELNWGNPK